jgi:riboflavin biosynthesis pyrimidine reductase
MGRKSRRVPSARTKEIKKPVWITNQYSRQLVHKWRSEEQAILVGTQTAIDDNPKLDETGAEKTLSELFLMQK